MNELSLAVNKQEWLDAYSAASLLKVSIRQIRRLFDRYQELLQPNYIKIIKSRGRNGHKIVISKEGLTILANMKDGNRGNQHSDSIRTPGVPIQGKKKIAEIAIDKSKLPDSRDLLRIVQKMVGLETEIMTQQMATMKEELEKVKQLALETPKVEMVTSQREFLNDRLRNYCAQTDVSHSFVWKKLHRYIGKESINEYRFDDYKPAIRYLKQMYQESRLEWN